MMLGFIEAHRQEHGVEPICKVLPIAPSTWRRHAARAADPAKLPARAQRDAGLKADIRRVFEENFQVYGVRKVWRQLQREGIQVARCTIARKASSTVDGIASGSTMSSWVTRWIARCGSRSRSASAVQRPV